MEYLEKHGWKVKNMVVGVGYPKHITKQKFIHQILGEQDPRLPKVRAHYSRCRWLVASIEGAGIRPDFTKDKGSERQDIDQRGATHGSDAFDYLLFYRYSEALSAAGSFSDRIRV